MLPAFSMAKPVRQNMYTHIKGRLALLKQAVVSLSTLLEEFAPLWFEKPVP